MAFIFFLLPLYLTGCRPKGYTSAYNANLGRTLLFRYDPADKNVIVQAEATTDKTFARLKFSPPQNRLKSFASKESTARQCVTRTDLGPIVSRTSEQWFSDIALEWAFGDNIAESSNTWKFSLFSAIDNPDSEIQVEVIVHQQPGRWIITIRNPLESTSYKLRNKYMALMVIRRSPQSENITRWNLDKLSKIAQEILDIRNALMACILSVKR
jgi:hypothetical protein